MKKNLRSMFVFVIVFGILGCLPLIPVLTAPVVPNRNYRLTSASLAGLFLGFGRVGSSYHWEWYTLAAILLLLAAGLVLSIFIVKRWAHMSKQQKGSENG